MINLINFENHEIDFSGYTLIIPSVSVGNVPQLTVDLLISTYDFKRVSTIWHPAVIPLVGSNPYNSNTEEISTACEIFINEKLELATIQLRSAIERNCALKFFTDLHGIVQNLHFKSIFILTSAFDYELHNVSTGKFYYVSNSTTYEEVMAINCVKPLETNLNEKYILNGGGFAIQLYQTLSQNLSCILLIKYVSEGDNRPDAVMTLKKLFVALQCPEIPDRLKCPSSWQFVFGGPPPVGIY